MASMGIRETLVSPSARAAEARTWLTLDKASDYVCGAIEVVAERDGWSRPRRFFASQTRAICSCMAWHPGLFRSMAQTTAGVCLRFATDATEIALAVRLDDESRGTARVLGPIDKGRRRRPHDGVSVVVDGRPVGCVMPEPLGRVLPWIEQSMGLELATFSLRDASVDPSDEIVAIPGLGKRREVCVWLPCLRGCVVRELWTNGTFVEPMAKRAKLLVLGDSIGQGFCSDDPAQTWAALLSERLSRELCNQSVGGQVFQPTMITDDAVDAVSHVIIELGLNYRWERCAPSQIIADTRAFVLGIRRTYPNARLCILTPTWCDESVAPSLYPQGLITAMSALEDAAKDCEACFVSGLELLDHDDRMLADGEHPNAAGHGQIAKRLFEVLDEKGW